MSHILIACDVYLIMLLILLRTTVALWGDLSLKFQDEIVFSPTVHRCYSSSFRDTTWWSGVISSTFKYNGCKTVLHTQNTRVKRDEPSIYRYGLGTLETERSNVNHIVDMVNIEMFTIENYSISSDDRTWFSWFGSSDHLDDLRDVYLSGSSLVIWLIKL